MKRVGIWPYPSQNKSKGPLFISSSMALHENSRNSAKEHHLYAIHDKEENDVFKYGISNSSIGKDGYSRRMREQVNFLNRAVGWARYFAEVLVKGIIGRKNALQKEDEYIENYRAEHGKPPRGNVDRGKKSL